jgi:hypothetical protein
MILPAKPSGWCIATRRARRGSGERTGVTGSFRFVGDASTAEFRWQPPNL